MARPFALATVMLFGCSSVTLAPSPVAPEVDNWVRRELARRPVQVQLRAGSPGLDDASSGTSLLALTPETVIVDSAPGALTFDRAQVRAFESRHRVAGGLEGLALGAGVGVVSGVALGLAAGDAKNLEDCGFPCRRGERAEWWGLLAGVTGAAVGAAIGVIVGHRHRLELSW
jgi:hypothetical protein